jgi:flagellar motor switch/type III secretory pathway protein FliN
MCLHGFTLWAGRSKHFAFLRPFSSRFSPFGHLSAGIKSMATVHPMPAHGALPVRAAPQVPAVTDTAPEKALVAAFAPPDDEAPIFKSPVARLPVELDVVVPVRDFRVCQLLALQPGQLIESQWVNGEDVPLAAGAVQLAWGEFEVIDNQLAVRVTRLN